MYKKFLLAFSAIAALTISASAQGNYSGSYRYQSSPSSYNQRAAHQQYLVGLAEANTWGYTRYQNIGYMIDNSLENVTTGETYRETDFGASLEFGNSYMFPKHAALGILKMGFDITWLDLQGVKYKNVAIVQDDFFGDEVKTKDDLYQFAAGAGIGLSLHLAPCAKLGSGAQPFRIEAYGRFIPTYSAILKRDANDDFQFHGAFMPTISYGAGIDYKSVGAGIEFRFGEASYNDLGLNGESVKLKNNQTRVYLSLHF